VYFNKFSGGARAGHLRSSTAEREFYKQGKVDKARALTRPILTAPHILAMAPHDVARERHGLERMRSKSESVFKKDVISHCALRPFVIPERGRT
jgi:hypothetical protein